MSRGGRFLAIISLLHHADHRRIIGVGCPRGACVGSLENGSFDRIRRHAADRCFGDGVQCPSCHSPQNGGTAVRLARMQGSFWWKGRSTLDCFVRLAVGQSRVRAEGWLVLRIVRGRVYSCAYIALLRPQRWPNFIFYKSAVPTDYFFAPAIFCLTTGNP